IITSQQHRSQIANKTACLDRLRQLIVRAQARPRKRKPTRVPRSSIENRLESKRRRAAVKQQRRRPNQDDS
ncbi:MAG: aminoacyl-tRNA hydrolase, partial [Desulfobacterales bacterium]|nr:aminoacyl-tRNA hydrolase [Desulfobacterales bacterium]